MDLTGHVARDRLMFFVVYQTELFAFEVHGDDGAREFQLLVGRSHASSVVV